jgi:hypothetical protein
MIREATNIYCHAQKKFFVACLLFSALSFGSQTCRADWVPYDDFNDGIRDHKKWDYGFNPGGKMPVERNGKLFFPVGGGVGYKPLPIEKELAKAGLDSRGKNHSLVTISDPTIIGMRMDMFLPLGSPIKSAVLMGLFELAGDKKLKRTVALIGNWEWDGVVLEFDNVPIENGKEPDWPSDDIPGQMGKYYRFTLINKEKRIRLLIDGKEVANYPSAMKSLGLFAGSFSKNGNPSAAHIDNVEVYYSDNAAGRITSDLSKSSLDKGKPIAPYTVRANFMARNFTIKNLPPGLKYSKTTGVISGTPNTKGTYPVSITARKLQGGKAVKSAKATKVFVIK